MEHEPLTDADIEAGGTRYNGPPSRDELAYQYKRLREHHAAVVAEHAAKDRALLIQTAAAIAGASFVNSVSSGDPMRDVRNIVLGSVHIARMLIAEADKPPREIKEN